MRYNAEKKREKYRQDVINYFINIMGENRLTATKWAEAWVKNGVRESDKMINENIFYALCQLEINRRYPNGL